MKLQNKQKQTTIIAIIVAAIALVLIIAGIVILSNPDILVDIVAPGVVPDDDDEPKVTGITMSSWPKREYYVGDTFDSTGAMIQLVATSQELIEFIGEDELTFSGFDSSVASEKVTITVTYQDFTTTYDVVVKEQPAPPVSNKTLVSISVSDNLLKTYTLKQWKTTGPYLDGARIIRTFSDGTTDEVVMTIDNCAWDRTISSACVYDMTVSYTYGGQTYTCTVPITITN